MRRWLLRVGLGGLLVVLALQLVPYGWWHENPPVVQDAPWPDAETAELARGACYDCHSNEAGEAIQDGSMPPSRYTPLHPAARLSDEEEARLVAALEELEQGDDSPGRGRGRGRGGND